MAINFPSSADTFTNPTATSKRNSPSLAGQQSDQNDAIEALESKIGTGASTPTANKVLRGTGTGITVYAQVDVTTDITGVLPVANGGTGVSSSPITVPLGGTGVTTITGIIKGNGTSAMTAVTAPSGTIVGDTDTQTLTNKTFTSPLFQGNVDGWTAVTGSWTYASASTINVPSGAASIYQKGDRIKFTQTSVKYFVVTAVADTLLTVAVNTDYTVANAVISSIYYSHQVNPLGYPNWFTFTTTWGGFSVNPTDTFAYNIIGNLCMFRQIDGASGTSNATTLTFTVPVAVVGTQNVMALCYVKDNSVNVTSPSHISSTDTSTTINAYKSFFQGAFTNSGTKQIFIGTIEYRF